MFSNRSDVISAPKKFTWTDFGRVYTPDILPRRYAPAWFNSKACTLSCPVVLLKPHDIVSLSFVCAVFYEV